MMERGLTAEQILSIEFFEPCRISEAVINRDLKEKKKTIRHWCMIN